MSAQASHPVHVLVVEDNVEDSDLIIEAFREANRSARFTVAEDGDEALAFLRREGAHLAAPRPDLIILDLNLPRRPGHEVLAQLKADPELRRIPVVVLTTSAAEQDVLTSYALHANCYITKPLDLDAFLGVVHTIDRFWLNVVTLPPA
jgi:CheY-like chemotaxis protein